MTPLSALCAVARLHQTAADPATLAHQLGLSSSDPLTASDLLRAAQHLGLKAKLSRSTPERLALTPLSALALMRSDDDRLRVVVLAQSDGQRVLLQDFAQGCTGRPTIEPVEVFTSQWTGQLILISSRASLAGELAKFRSPDPGGNWIGTNVRLSGRCRSVGRRESRLPPLLQMPLLIPENQAIACTESGDLKFDFSWFIPALVKYRKLLGEVLNHHDQSRQWKAHSWCLGAGLGIAFLVLWGIGHRYPGAVHQLHRAPAP